MDGEFNEEEYEEAKDKQEEQEEAQDDYEYQKEEENRMGMAYPTPRDSESLYNLFHKVLGLQDSSKVANLNQIELGMLNISARDCQRISLLAETLGHAKFAAYFKGVAEIILTTSASKKGWFTELFVSQKKFSSKSKEQEANLKKKRFGLGGGG